MRRAFLLAACVVAMIGRWKRGCGEWCLICSFVWSGFFGCVLELIVVCVWGVFLICGVVRKTPPSRHSEILAFFRDLMTLPVLQAELANTKFESIDAPEDIPFCGIF